MFYFIIMFYRVSHRRTMEQLLRMLRYEIRDSKRTIALLLHIIPSSVNDSLETSASYYTIIHQQFPCDQTILLLLFKLR